MVSGCTVCSEASNGVGLGASGTFARPPALASRKNEIFIPWKMELKGWITDCTRSSFQGITLNAVMLFTVDLQKMVPNELHQYIDWDPTRTEQGNWLTKTIVNVWFMNETNLTTMIGLLKAFKDELKKVPNKIRDQEVKLLISTFITARFFCTTCLAFLFILEPLHYLILGLLSGLLFTSSPA